MYGLIIKQERRESGRKKQCLVLKQIMGKARTKIIDSRQKKKYKNEVVVGADGVIVRS